MVNAKMALNESHYNEKNNTYFHDIGDESKKNHESFIVDVFDFL